MKLIITDLDKHQDEVIQSLQKEYEAQWEVCQKEMDKLDIISRTMAKFQASILMAKTNWKIEEQN